jgi:hypothetical protein
MNRSRLMKAFALLLISAGVLLAVPKPKEKEDASQPQYTKDNELLRPANYREWVYLSSGLGMSYSASKDDPDPGFTNVFVPQASYRQFLQTGKWPDKTLFVVEERSSTSKGSINKVGRYQTEFGGMGVEVKDSRFPDGWAYFNFGGDTASAKANPKGACWSCHDANAAVEHTFVQFYPTLKPVAEKFGVYKQTAEDAPKQ